MAAAEGQISAPVCAILEALSFREPSPARLRGLPDEQWPALMTWCDRRQITLLLGEVCGGDLPASVSERILACRARAAERFSRLESQLGEMIRWFDEDGLQFVLLKGISHAPALTPNPLLRAQGDIDLWFTGNDAFRARDILAAHGYVSKHSSSGRHLPPMTRPSRWTWQGDMFDPNMPVAIELHHHLWFEDADRIPLPGESGFWTRRIRRDFNAGSAGVLCTEDLLGFAALHLLLHLLHGDLPVQRAWEIANFLERHAGDVLFWQSWGEFHEAELRRLETVVFRIVQRWFQCALPPRIEEETKALPHAVRLWLDRFALAPLARDDRPNKDELWLHLALIPSIGARLPVIARRLFPLGSRRRSNAAGRLRHHIRTLVPTLIEGLRWYRLMRQPST